MPEKENLNFEINRKLFHVCSIIFPITYLFVSKFNMVVTLLILAIITIYIDVHRNHNLYIKKLADSLFGSLQRAREKSGESALSGASYMVSGFFLTALLFPQGLVITSWLILIISDCLAAIIGKKYGSPLANGKSALGFMVFFLSALFISISTYFTLNYNTSFPIIVTTCLLCAITEFISNEVAINDNFSIPVIYCLATFILNLM